MRHVSLFCDSSKWIGNICDFYCVVFSYVFFLFFFFFQAEDGIRDIGVTGVQTCALPIWSSLKSLELLSQDVNERKTALTLRDLKIQGNNETDQDCFPAITCTEVNIPKILKRSISIESETYNWLFGLPNQRTKPASLIAKELRLAKRFTKETKVSQKEEDLKRKRSSRVQKSIVYNVPISLSTESKWKRNFPTHSYSYSEINGMDVQQSQKDSNKLPPVITDNVLGGNLRGKISVKLQNK